MAEPRTYSFSPRDRGGWVLGMAGPQCLLLAAGVVAAVGLLQAGAHPALALAPLGAGTVAAFAPVGGEQAWALVPVALRFWLDRRRGMRPLAVPADGLLAVPGVGQVELMAAPAPWAGGAMAVVVDRKARSVTGVVRAAGRSFALAERADQERLLAAWGDALGAFCIERTPVSQVVVSAWTGPSRGTTVARSRSADLPADYAALLAEAQARFNRTEVLVAVTVEARRLRGAASGGDALERAARALVEEVRLLVLRLEAAGLRAAPLAPAELADCVSQRIDPTPTSTARTLAEAAARRARRGSWSPSWERVRAGDSVHAAWWVSEWPRLAVGPAWLEPLLLGVEGARSLAILLEPVSPRASRRRIERDATRLAADEEQRARAGFRIGARHRRVRAALGEREADLAAGYAELAFAGAVVATAPDADALEQRAGELEQSCGQCGLELVRLQGRHDLALGLTLGLGASAAGGGMR